MTSWICLEEESQNHSGWKGPLENTQPTLPAQAGSARVGYPGPLELHVSHLHVCLHHVQQHLRTINTEQLHISFTLNASGISKPDLPYGPNAWPAQSILLHSYRSPSLKHNTAKDPLHLLCFVQFAKIYFGQMFNTLQASDK